MPVWFKGQVVPHFTLTQLPDRLPCLNRYPSLNLCNSLNYGNANQRSELLSNFVLDLGNKILNGWDK